MTPTIVSAEPGRFGVTAVRDAGHPQTGQKSRPSPGALRWRRPHATAGRRRARKRFYRFGKCAWPGVGNPYGLVSIPPSEVGKLVVLPIDLTGVARCSLKSAVRYPSRK
jgi:hypothetical protein